jgi:hypothetical protein
MPTLHHGFGVFDESTGRMLEYRQLINDPRYRDTWHRSAANEFGRLAQGVGNRITGTNTIQFICKEDVPKDRSVTYGRFVCTIRPQKDEPERTRLTVGGNLVDYPGRTSTPTADMTTWKLQVNDILSTPNARALNLDIGNFYLNTPLDRPEYMRILFSLFPPEIVSEYRLSELVSNDGHIYIKILKGMYGLPQAGRLANQLLQQRLADYGYYPVRHTPGLWRHVTNPDVNFVLVVDDFSFKYTQRHTAEHFLAILRQWYPVKEDWNATLYCGITVDWDYTQRKAYLSMPGYIHNALTELQHPPPTKPQYSPHPHLPIQYGNQPQLALAPDTSPPLNSRDRAKIPQAVGKLLYYARAVDSTLLVALSALAAEQNQPTHGTLRRLHHLLDYCYTNPNARLCFHASDMVLHFHSDAGYNSESGARSRSGGHFFLSSKTPGKPIQPNGAILNPTTIIRHVPSSAADAEIGATFINCKEAIPIRTTLEELGYPQPATPVTLDNTTAIGFVHDTIKQRRTRAIDMRYHWLRDRETQEQFQFRWDTSSKNLADYFTKHHSPAHHRAIRSHYVLATRHHHSNTFAHPLRGCVDPSKHPAHARKPDRCPLAMPTRARQPIRLLETLHQP